MFRYLVAIFFCFAFIFASCEDDRVVESVSELSFSSDTISFDTIFTGINSVTKKISVKNNSGNDINIENIKLVSNGSSGFFINFDGDNGTSFDNIKIQAKDSLFLFVKYYSDNKNRLGVIKNEDKIIFKSKQNSKIVILEAKTLDAKVLKGLIVHENTILSDEYPFLVYDSLVVEKNANLIIPSGCKFYMHNGAFVKVQGRIIIKGHIENPVVFTGDRLDKIFENLAYAFYPGQWQGIEIATSSYDNLFKGVVIKGANYGLYIDSCDSYLPKVFIKNSIIHNMTNSCLVNNGALIKVENSQITNAGGDVVKLIGGKNVFNQCTLANYENLINRSGVTLNMEKFDYQSEAIFNNTVIAGSSVEEIKLDSMINIFFLNCAFKTSKKLNNKNCIYLDKYEYNSANFLKLGSDKDNYIFDFGLNAKSELIDRGSQMIYYSYDLKGNERSWVPDIGAYEYIGE